MKTVDQIEREINLLWQEIREFIDQHGDGDQDYPGFYSSEDEHEYARLLTNINALRWVLGKEPLS